MARVRLQDVAERAGVSMKTVSNVVRDQPYVSESMRERVQRAIDELGYRPNLVGRRLATGRTGFVALGIPDLSHPYYAKLAHVTSRQAELLGYRVLITETSGSLDGERAVVRSSEAGLVDGVIFNPSVMTAREVAAHRDDLPMVLLGESPAPLTMDWVAIDNVAAAREITRRLIEAGCRRIGFVGHEFESLSATSLQRIEGYEQALREAGITPDPRLMIPTGAELARKAVDEVGAALDGGLTVDAFACRDDLAALGTLRAAQHRGLRVPEDVMITGWDNVFMTEVTHPSMTTIAPDLEHLVAMALQRLVERIAGYDGIGRHDQAPYSVMVRESAPLPGLAEAS